MGKRGKAKYPSGEKTKRERLATEKIRSTVKREVKKTQARRGTGKRIRKKPAGPRLALRRDTENEIAESVREWIRKERSVFVWDVVLRLRSAAKALAERQAIEILGTSTAGITPTSVEEKKDDLLRVNGICGSNYEGKLWARQFLIRRVQHVKITAGRCKHRISDEQQKELLQGHRDEVHALATRRRRQGNKVILISADETRLKRHTS